MEPVDAVKKVVAEELGHSADLSYQAVLDSFRAKFEYPMTSREKQLELLKVASLASQDKYVFGPGVKEALRVFVTAFRGLEKPE